MHARSAAPLDLPTLRWEECVECRLPYQGHAGCPRPHAQRAPRWGAYQPRGSR